MTPEEIQAHAAEAKRRYLAAQGVIPPVSAAPDPFAVARADGSLGPVVAHNDAVPVKQDPFKEEVLPAGNPALTAPLPQAAPQVANDVPPTAPVTDGSQEPVPVAPVVPGRRVQTADAFHVGPLPIGANDIADRGDAALETSQEEFAAPQQAQASNLQTAADIEKNIHDAQAPIEADKADMDGYLAQQAQQDMAEADVNAKKHFDVLMGYNKEIQDHIANQPTDLWGRAGVNKVAGIIGLVLSGLGGGATGGKNMAVETLNTLVEQNLKQNEYKYEMLKGKVTAENQAYAQVRETSHDKAEAADRYRLLCLEQYKQQMQQAAGQFAGEKAQNQADMAIAQADIEAAKIHQKLMEDSNANFRAAASVGVAERGQNLQSIQLDAEMKGAARKEADEQYVPGWVMPEGKHIPASEAEKLRLAQGGASQVQQIMSEMRKQARIGGAESVVSNTALAADLKQALIKQRMLSNRVSKDEGALLEQSISFLAAGKTASFLQLFGAKTVEEALAKAQQRFAKSWETNLTKGYGYQPDQDNQFSKSARGDFSDYDEADPSVGGPQAGATGSDPLSGYQSRSQVQQAAAAARSRMQTPAYTGND